MGNIYSVFVYIYLIEGGKSTDSLIFCFYSAKQDFFAEVDEAKHSTSIE